MKKSRGIATLLVFLVVLGLVSWSAGSIIFATGSGTGEGRRIKLGLDLAGGVSITYQTVKDDPTDEEMNDTINKLQKRVEAYSTEAQVYKEGADRISIEIPGVSDANAILEELGKPGSLVFQLEDGSTVLTGTDVADAKGASYSEQLTGIKKYAVSLSLTPQGTAAFAKATSENIGKRIAIIYDGQTISNPTVQSAISDGNAQITGMESYEAAEQLASQIRIGSLSLELKELHSKVVGAQLGTEALDSSIKAAVIGLGLIIIFMIVFYLLPGLAAGLALILYSVLTVVVLWAFDITLTLPGIAGIALSIGMAVDANIIIIARIREEIAAEKTVEAATKIGYKKALSAIIDGHVTALISAIILGLRGSGPVKGFAYTLGIGIVLSLFTALFVAKWIQQGFYALGLQNRKLYGMHKERSPINFLSKRFVFFAIAIVVVASGFVGMGIKDASKGSILNYSLDFQGGSSTTVTFNQDYSIQEISREIVPVVEGIVGDGDVQTQKVDGTNDVVIKTRALNLTEREQFNKAMVDKFGVDENTIISENISSTVSNEMKTDAIWAVVLATFCMLIYIWFRFKDIRFASAAVIALICDVLVVLAFYVWSWTSVGNTFIACMLTIVGFSINATIIIFDRVREHLAETKNRDREAIGQIVNRSITQTLARSINTNLTVFIMLLVLWIMGVTAIKEFAAPLMVGIIGGTFSSICVTAPLWYTLRNIGKKK